MDRASVSGTAISNELDNLELESLYGETFLTRPYRPWGSPNLLYYYRVIPGRGVNHSRSSGAKVKERVELRISRVPTFLPSQPIIE
jgi:hypothetical protein